LDPSEIYGFLRLGYILSDSLKKGDKTEFIPTVLKNPFQLKVDVSHNIHIAIECKTIPNPL